MSVFDTRGIGWWEMLDPGQMDPYNRVIGNDYCKMPSPCAKYVCTRPVAHIGLHVASYGDSRVCCRAWQPLIPREMQLPEGF